MESGSPLVLESEEAVHKLTIYRRHRQSCDYKAEGRKYRRCRCPIWADGTLDGREIRKSTGLASWEKAQALVREWEAEGSEGREGPIGIEEARDVSSPTANLAI